MTPPDGVDVFISTRRKTFTQVAKEVRDACLSNSMTTSLGVKKSLIIFDSVHPLTTRRPHSHGGPVNIVNYFGSILAINAPNPSSQTQIQASLLAVYHSDIPVQSAQADPYAPSLYSLLSYLATAILTVHSTHHILAGKAARDKSLAAPLYGLAAEEDGVVVGLKSTHSKIGMTEITPEDRDSLIIQLDHRRRSGRNVEEWYYLPAEWSYDARQPREVVTLLDDHPLWKKVEEPVAEEMPETTFELGLTEKQRRDREKVVLPYFDAQKGDGPGEGGRILYDMGEEDDFDEEEDEI